MKIDADLAVRTIEAAEHDLIPRCELLIGGKGTGRILKGAVLEGAVSWASCRLLFLTDDIPYEEMLRIVLLDADLKILDRATIGCMYSTGSFSSLQVREPDQVRFRFIGDITWTVQLLHTPSFRVPFLSEPRGVHRSWGFSRRFIVSGNPQPSVPA